MQNALAPPLWAGPDGEWLRHASWEPILDKLMNREAGRVALEHLREEFPPQWSMAAADHPVLIDCAFTLNRIALVEMGHVLATVPCRKIRPRLRSRGQYLGVRAELRAGALLLTAGAKLTHEPLPPDLGIPKSKRPSGPDWRATWPDGSIHVEVKLPRTSVRAHRREGWASLYMMHFQEALGADVSHSDGMYATLYLSETLLDDMRTRLEDTSFVRRCALDAAAAFTKLASLPHGLERLAGPVSLVDGCDVVVRSRVDGREGLVIDGTFVVSDEDSVSLRLKDDLQRAAHQLKDTPGHRVILIDTSCDSTLQRHAETIRSLLATEGWADKLAAIMIVHRHHPYTTVDLVPGPADDSSETLRLIASNLRTCERSHLHAEPLVAQVSTCKLYADT
jgi:hypothetical protein